MYCNCPIEDWTCPYYKYTGHGNGYCSLEDTEDECDAFYDLGENDEEEGE